MKEPRKFVDIVAAWLVVAAAVARKRALVLRQDAEDLAGRVQGWMTCHTGQSVGTGAAVVEIVAAAEFERIAAVVVAGRRAVVGLVAFVAEAVAGVRPARHDRRDRGRSRLHTVSGLAAAGRAGAGGGRAVA